MIIETSDWTRIFLIYGIQLSLGIFFFYFGIIILRRNQNNLGCYLSGFYLTIACAAFLNTILILIRADPLAFILYFVILYLGFFAHSFLIVFARKLIEPYVERQFPNGFKILLAYAVMTFLILLYPGGFKYNEHTNWRPKFNFYFLVMLYIYYTLFLLGPLLVF